MQWLELGTRSLENSGLNQILICRTLGSSFTLCCSSLLRHMNESIFNMVYLCLSNFHALIPAWLNASQRN